MISLWGTALRLGSMFVPAKPASQPPPSGRMRPAARPAGIKPGGHRYRWYVGMVRRSDERNSTAFKSYALGLPTE